jgi:uncharacterized protein
MSGERDLATLLRSMQPVLRPEVYVFVTLPPGEPAPAKLSPVMTFREDEGVTLIVSRHEAKAAGLAGAFSCRMITLNVHSSLQAVGFLATVAARLAAAGISANAASAFYHDHLFVPVERAEEAVMILKQLAGS